jgi:glutamyl-Q tRNA(Asp) synthetase
MNTRVFRFAPSPNGRLHLGHALSALLNADMARATAGRLLLRIEDIDGTRARDTFVAAIEDDLAWLGFEPERPVRRQSEHESDYRQALTRLTEMGLTYVSFLSRTEIKAAIAAASRSAAPWPTDPDGAPLYPGPERLWGRAEVAERLATGALYSIRLDMQKAVARVGRLDWQEFGDQLDGLSSVMHADAAAWGDVVLAGKYTPASYHLAVVVDDALQGVTDVVRGRDLFFATAVHRLLQTLLDLPCPRYHHHRLIVGDDGRKLAKSEKSRALAALRAEGASPTDIRRLVGLGN